MSFSAIKTLPKLAGTLATVGPWQSLYARNNHRIYPYELGATVRTDTADPTITGIPTNGLGDFAVDDYFIVCRAVDYGGASLFVPDLTRVGRVASFGATVGETTDPTVATDDIIWPATSSPGQVVTGEYLLNIGQDSATSPYSGQNLDGSGLTLYSDNVGTLTNPYPYLLTTQGGSFLGWITSGIRVIDVLVTDSSGTPLVVVPFITLGEEVVV